ncbi:MAG: PEP-CTERM sorting domain-containing protein [Deltaproteobacteria bacterium]|nr:MAG: PEP-CTERM sorting domain-containing protein [Deltaproteobacteria bacterium]
MHSRSLLCGSSPRLSPRQPGRHRAVHAGHRPDRRPRLRRELGRGRQPALRRERDHHPPARRRGAECVHLRAGGGLHVGGGLRVHLGRRGRGLDRGERLGREPADRDPRARPDQLGQPGVGQPVSVELQLHGRGATERTCSPFTLAQTPEPGTGVLLGLALTAFGVARRRRA